MFFVAIVFATPMLFSQYKLSGIVKDKDTQEPVKNAVVYFSDLKKMLQQTKMVIILFKI